MSEPASPLDEWRQWPVDWEKVQPRPYQIESAQQILRKGNTLLVMPTALGKTFVAVLVYAGLLKANPQARALFLAPTKPLALQQAHRMQELLKLNPTDGGVVVLTGETAPQKRVPPWRQAQVVVATPQTCAWDVKAGRAKLEGFALLVVDECHRAVGDYAYAELGRLSQATANLLVLGLTASPSSDEDKVGEIRANLGAKNVIVKTEDDPAVRQFVQQVEVDWEYVHLPPVFARLKSELDGLLADAAMPLVKRGFVKPRGPGGQVDKKSLLLSRGPILAAIGRGDKSAYSSLSAQARCLNLMHAADLLESQGLHSLDEFLTGFSTRKDASKAVRDLAADKRVQQIALDCRKALQAGVEHPKFARANSIVSQAVASGQSVIVFAHYRDSVGRLQEMLNRNEGVRAAKLVGKSGGGMNQKEQAQVVADFRNGLHNVLVASSVAEEGLDIPSVDLVLFFEPVPSEIRSIQRRGRAGRVKAGLTRVLIAKGTKDEALFWISRRKEQLMHEHMADLSQEPSAGQEGSAQAGPGLQNPKGDQRSLKEYS